MTLLIDQPNVEIAERLLGAYIWVAPEPIWDDSRPDFSQLRGRARGVLERTHSKLVGHNVDGALMELLGLLDDGGLDDGPGTPHDIHIAAAAFKLLCPSKGSAGTLLKNMRLDDAAIAEWRKENI